MTGVNMRQIEVFLCAARHENISRAAAELYISQPALSKAIKSIEKDFGSPLFNRTNRGVKLTEEGRVFKWKNRRSVRFFSGDTFRGSDK